MATQKLDDSTEVGWQQQQPDDSTDGRWWQQQQLGDSTEGRCQQQQADVHTDGCWQLLYSSQIIAMKWTELTNHHRPDVSWCPFFNAFSPNTCYVHISFTNINVNKVILNEAMSGTFAIFWKHPSNNHIDMCRPKIHWQRVAKHK